MKNILIETHERSGTHLVINCINYKNNGDFKPIGKLSKDFTIDNYIKQVNRNVTYNLYDPDVIYKSHHQVEFFDNCINELFENYKVIYVKRNIKDVLLSYYRFLNSDENKRLIKGFPFMEDWIFMRPSEVGYKFFADYPDPHVIIEPKNYIERILLHQRGWMKHKENILIVEYETILNNYKDFKDMVEDYLKMKISDKIPDLNDPNLPNFVPNKGVVGEHKNIMSKELIEKIDNEINEIENIHSQYK